MGRTFASEIWGAYVRGGGYLFIYLFSFFVCFFFFLFFLGGGGGVVGGAYYRNFTVFRLWADRRVPGQFLPVSQQSSR